jgi:hypothetical protein
MENETEYYEGLDKRSKEYKDWKLTQEDETEEAVELDTTNPFNAGVSYEAFLKNVEGDVTVESLCKKAKLSDSETAWIKSEIKTFKNK